MKATIATRPSWRAFSPMRHTPSVTAEKISGMTIIWIAWMNAAPIGCSVLPSPGHSTPTSSPRISPASICNGSVKCRRVGALPESGAMLSSPF